MPKPSPDTLFAGEHADLRKEIATIVAEPTEWLDQPNDQLGGRKPKELLGTPEEQLLRDLVRAIKHGMPT